MGHYPWFTKEEEGDEIIGWSIEGKSKRVRTKMKISEYLFILFLLTGIVLGLWSIFS